MEKRKVSFNESEYYISAWGNENIIRNYVAYFEKRMEGEVAELNNLEFETSSAQYPNFAAWIRFYTELICNSLYWKLLRYEGNGEKIIKKRFDVLIKHIIEKIEQEIAHVSQEINENEKNKMTDSIYLILNLRHSFQHGGLPNLMRKLSNGIDQDKFKSMLQPSNYRETKEIYLNAERLLKLLPQPPIAF
jgi:hypothetical protein